MDAENQAREDLVRIYRAALDAVAPERLIAAALRGELSGAESVPALIAAARRILVLGVGKASLRMMRAAVVGLAGRIADAIEVGAATDARRAGVAARFFPGGHPLPDENSVRAARAVLAMLAGVAAGDLLIVLLSGGASAMI